MNKNIILETDKEKLRDQEHNYEVYERENGFEVFPIEKDRLSVKATLSKTGFWRLETGSKTSGLFMGYCFYNLLDSVVSYLYETWKSPVCVSLKEDEIDKLDENEKEEYYKKRRSYDRVERWARLMTRKTLAKKIRDIWKVKLNSLDSEIEAIQRLAYATSPNGNGFWDNIILITENRERFKYLIQDFIKYRACRCAVLSYDMNYTDFSDWKKLCGNIENGSMRKTIMNFPGGVPYFYIKYFAKLQQKYDVVKDKYTNMVISYYDIPEPAITRIRFLAYVALIRGGDTNFKNVILRSSDEDLKNAVKYIWKKMPNGSENDFRRLGSILGAFGIIFDYPHSPGKWDILGLAKRSEKWHREITQNRRENQRKNLLKDERVSLSNTALPPIPLPNDMHIQFLDTFMDVVNEGDKMSHCIASYAERAVNGKCYLFHVDYMGEMASVEVDTCGYVNQSYGPYDRHNKASKYGEQILAKWGKDIQKSKNKSPKLRHAEIEGEKLSEIPIEIPVNEYDLVSF